MPKLSIPVLSQKKKNLTEKEKKSSGRREKNKNKTWQKKKKKRKEKNFDEHIKTFLCDAFEYINTIFPNILYESS